MYCSDRSRIRIQDFDMRAKALIYCQDFALGIPPHDHTLQFSGIYLILNSQLRQLYAQDMIELLNVLYFTCVTKLL